MLTGCGQPSTVGAESDSSTSAGTTTDLPLDLPWEPMECDSAPITGWRAVAAGPARTCGISLAGDIHCWPQATGTNTPPCDAALDVALGSSGASIAADGRLFNWTQDPDFRGPFDGPFKQIDVGGSVCAIRSDTGLVECFGGFGVHDWGQPPDTKFLEIAVGDDFGCGVTETQAVECWGTFPNEWGEPPSSSYAATTLDATGQFLCTVSTMGEIDCFGQPLPAAPAGPFTDVAVGSRGYVCAIRADETLQCWGDDARGQVSDAPPGAFVEVSAGTAHACALKESGEIECWGDPLNGATTPPV